MGAAGSTERTNPSPVLAPSTPTGRWMIGMGDYRLISTISSHTAFQPDLVCAPESSVFNFNFLLVDCFQDQSHCTFVCDAVQTRHSLCCCQVSAVTLTELFGLDYNNSGCKLDIKGLLHSRLGLMHPHHSHNYFFFFYFGSEHAAYGQALNVF